MDRDYSVSPDGRLSILINSDNHLIHINRYQNDSSIWPPLKIDDNIAQWNYHLYEPSEINNELDEILAVVAIDMDRFVYVGLNGTHDVRIGVIEIVSIYENFILLNKLNSSKLDILVDDLILCYDIQLGFNVYLSTLSHFVVYNFENFEYRLIDWSDTANSSVLSDPLSLLILDQTHFLMGTDAFDDFGSVIIALIEIHLNQSSLNLSMISYELIDLSNTKYLRNSITHISLSMNIYGNILIGLPEINRVLFVDFNMNEQRFTSNNRTFLMKIEPKSFGYSVIWLPDQHQFAVNAYDDTYYDLTYSQIYIFDYDDEHLWIRSIFPNNQQIKSIPVKPIYFHNFILFNEIFFGIIASRDMIELFVMIFPSISGGRGIFDLDFDLHFEEFYPYLFARIEPCLPGMYKNNNKSIGPCFLCPTGTKASTYGNLECQSCLNPLKCPLGSIKDQDEYPRIIQTVNYPESSDITAFDDIILSNMFSFECLIISPVFWMFMTISIIILFSLIGYCSRYRSKILQCFEHIDLIGHGHCWMGGIISCGICVLVIFAALFSMKFIYLYPFEEIKQSPLICNRNLYNAKFTSGLQFLALPKSDEERPIFELLDEQPFILTIDLINTLINCTKIDIIQKNGDYFGFTRSFQCSRDENNFTVSLKIPLLSHLTSTEIDLLELNFVGSVRVCLKGNNKTTNQRYQLRELLVCETFSDVNDTMSSRPEFDITLTKVINRTESLNNGDLPKYAGLWIPLITGKDVTTKLMYEPICDDYQRYYYRSSKMIIRLSESQFYIQNKQEPIARKFEILFHNILFLGVILELFGLTFLISKLLLLPFTRLILNRCSKSHPFILNINHQKETIIDIENTRM